MNLSSKCLIVSFCFSVIATPGALGCRGGFQRMSRMFTQLTERMSNDIESEPTKPEFIRINSPGQRFTATHGVSLRKGETKHFVFVVDRNDVNYMAISSNIALSGIQGGPDRYELYLKYGGPASVSRYDQKSTVTASESYIGSVLYSRDISLSKPRPGHYFLLLEAKKDFHELLITAIMDTPPEKHEPSFTIQRMGTWS